MIHIGRNQNPILVSLLELATHLMVVGSPGSGKTTFLESLLCQLMLFGHGVAVLDAQGDLFKRLVRYAAILRRRAVLLDFTNDEWVTPFNPFVRLSGDVSVQVDRRVKATLVAWGMASANDTPRLEKWLKCIYTVLIEKGLTIADAGLLIDPDPKVRKSLLKGISDPSIQRKLDQLAAFKDREFLIQIESAENRLMRFASQDSIGRTMGAGGNAIDCAGMMDRGEILLANLAMGMNLSEPQQRLAGVMLVNEFYEAAMRRPSGATPFFLVIDEAGLFVTPELGKSLDYCRQKGLHLTLAFQHLFQFKAEDMKTYKSVKASARSKVIFAIEDREDAMELAGDLVPDMAVPVVKYEIYGTAFKPVNKLILTTGTNEAVNEGETVTVNGGHTSGLSLSYAKAKSGSAGTSRGSNSAGLEQEGESAQEGATLTDTLTESGSETSGWANTKMKAHTKGKSVRETFITEHEEYKELRSVQFYTLQERHWSEAERIMRQKTGEALVKIVGREAVWAETPMLVTPLPKQGDLVRFEEAIPGRIPRAEAERIISDRRASLLDPKRPRPTDDDESPIPSR